MLSSKTFTVSVKRDKFKWMSFFIQIKSMCCRCECCIEELLECNWDSAVHLGKGCFQLQPWVTYGNHAMTEETPGFVNETPLCSADWFLLAHSPSFPEQTNTDGRLSKHRHSLTHDLYIRAAALQSEHNRWKWAVADIYTSLKAELSLFIMIMSDWCGFWICKLPISKCFKCNGICTKCSKRKSWVISLYILINVYLFICLPIVHTHTCVYVCVYICMYMYILYVCVYTVCVYIYICVCVCILCVYIYIYIYI